MPYAIEVIDTGERIRHFSSLPAAFDLPDGRRIISPVAVGDEGLGYRFIEIVQVGFSRPGTYFTRVEPDVETRDGAVVTITRSWTAWTQGEIDAYETARLDAITAQIDAADDLLRAVALVMRDEFNRHSVVHRAILQAAADAGNLTQFKTACALIEPVPERSVDDIRAAIRAKLDVA
jgi:hypothetical protein